MENKESQKKEYPKGRRKLNKHYLSFMIEESLYIKLQDLYYSNLDRFKSKSDYYEFLYILAAKELRKYKEPQKELQEQSTNELTNN
ncbi:MAG: hypothetical protein QXI16_00240 [Sulfolobaceae archaeon]